MGWIPDSGDWILDSKALDPGFHRQKSLGFWILDSLTWGEQYCTYVWCQSNYVQHHQTSFNRVIKRLQLDAFHNVEAVEWKCRILLGGALVPLLTSEDISITKSKEKNISSAHAQALTPMAVVSRIVLVPASSPGLYVLFK